jgi:hypothetical protein
VKGRRAKQQHDQQVSRVTSQFMFHGGLLSAGERASLFRLFLFSQANQVGAAVRHHVAAFCEGAWIRDNPVSDPSLPAAAYGRRRSNPFEAGQLQLFFMRALTFL